MVANLDDLSSDYQKKYNILCRIIMREEPFRAEQKHTVAKTIIKIKVICNEN